MPFSRNRCLQMLQKNLELYFRGVQAETHLKRAKFNAVLLLLLLFDLSLKYALSLRWSYFFVAEYVAVAIVALNAVACLVMYNRLLSSCVQENGKTSAQKKRYCGEDHPYRSEFPIINWHSSFVYSPCCCHSKHRSGSSTRTPQRQNANAEVPHEYFLTDVRKLPALMKIARRERRSLEYSNEPPIQISGNSFWNCCHKQQSKTVYQLAPQPPVCTENAPTTVEDFSSFQFKDSSSVAIRRLATDRLAQYVANLRYWLSTTILQRLVIEIDHVDEMFQERGLSHLKIGAVSLERLRMAAENQRFVETCAPSLPMLLPFLDAFSNQEYLVQRIKELSQGYRLADYAQKEANDYLPSDAAIVFHLFCAYLDSQLMLIHPRERRPFYYHYVLLRDERRSSIPLKDIPNAVHNQAHCAILCSGIPLDPRFNFISDKELHSCAYDRNNLFCVIIQFLLYMRQQQDSSLEGLNLGKSGINIMCVIEG